MEEVQYWIARLPAPDQPFLTLQQIQALNQEALRAEPTAADPLTLEDRVDAAFFLLPIERGEFALLKKVLYDRNGRRASRPFFDDLKEEAGLKNIPSLIPVRFGLIVEECALRTLPTMEPVTARRGDLAFDLLQETTLHPGTPVAVLWESRNGEWLYLVSSLLRGWTQVSSVAFFDTQEQLRAYMEKPNVVVTDRSVPFYAHPENEQIGAWTMGTILHTDPIQEKGDFYQIHRPVRDATGKIAFAAVYLPKEGVSEGYLPLTGRQILTQAFKLQGAPYGWGGLQKGWDCSSFLRDVFLTMGVTLPRNSEPQSRMGEILGTFSEKREEEKKRELLNQSVPAATFVKLDGHIMLYLGKVDNRHYVIHSMAGYREEGALWGTLRDRVVTAFRVLVSDMDLGKGGLCGSLLERTVSINFPFSDGAR